MKDFTPNPTITPTLLYDLTVIGDAFVELRAIDSSLPEADSFDRMIGGSAAMISIYTALLGDKACCIASVGADAMGTFVHNTLRDYKININGLQYSREFQTSVLFSTMSQQLRQLLYYRLADWQLHNTKDHVSLAQSSRIVHACGLSLWKHPARHSIFEILRLTKKMNITTVLHPCFDPVIWRDHTDAIATIKKTLQFVDIATPTLEDASHLFGKALREDYVKRFLDLGADSVILTMGKDGCLVSDGRKIIMVPGVETDSIVDKSGSNEAWHAGLFYAINQGKELAHAAYFANAIAAYVEQHNGSLVPLPSVGELCERIAGRRFEDI